MKHTAVRACHFHSYYWYDGLVYGCMIYDDVRYDVGLIIGGLITSHGFILAVIETVCYLQGLLEGRQGSNRSFLWRQDVVQSGSPFTDTSIR